MLSDNCVSRTSTLLPVTFSSYWSFRIKETVLGIEIFTIMTGTSSLTLTSCCVSTLLICCQPSLGWSGADAALCHGQSRLEKIISIWATDKVRVWALWAPYEWRESQVSYAPQQSNRDPGSLFFCRFCRLCAKSEVTEVQLSVSVVSLKSAQCLRQQNLTNIRFVQFSVRDGHQAGGQMNHQLFLSAAAAKSGRGSLHYPTLHYRILHSND